MVKFGLEVSNSAHLQSSYLLNVKGNYWKIVKSKKGISLDKKLSENHIDSHSSSSENEIASPYKQFLSLQDSTATVNSLDNNLAGIDLQIHELESFIKNLKQHVLQLEVQLTELKGEKNRKLNEETIFNNVASKNQPLVMIHSIPPTMNNESFNVTFRQRPVNSKVADSPKGKNGPDYPSDESVTSINSSTVSEASTIPYVVIPEDEIIIAENNKKSINCNNTSFENISADHVNVDKNVKRKREADTRIDENQDVTAHNLPQSESGLQVSPKRKKHKLLPTSPYGLFKSTPPVTNANIEETDIEDHNCHKINKRGKVKKKKILDTLCEHEGKTAVLFNHVQSEKPLNILTTSLTSSDEMKLFKDSFSSDDSSSIFEPIPKRTRSETVKWPSPKKQLTTPSCYVKLIHQYKCVNGSKIYK